jgi:micrococcal nuclease
VTVLARTCLRHRIVRSVAGLLAATSLIAGCGNGYGTDAAVGTTRRVRVLRVTDGDTFHVLRGRRDVTIRLIGIDTPEVGWYGGKAECYGAAAGRFLRRRIDGERVRLEFDRERLDPYDRTLAYGHHEGKMLNVLLVRKGYARVTIYEPNDRYEGRLHGAQRAAKAEGAGLWSAC